MISKLINNILAANDEHRGICQSSLIRIELDRVIDFLNANDIYFDDEQDILEMFKRVLGDGNWYVSITDGGDTLQICEIPDNWVRVYINNDGKVDDAYYV